MEDSGPENALQEARVALERVSTDEDDEGVATDNNAFTCLIDAVLALKRVSDQDTDEYRVLDNLHEDIVETYTNVAEREDGVVAGSKRVEYHDSLHTICERLEDEYDMTIETEE